MLISLSSVSKSFGEEELFSGVDLSVEKYDIIGLVGANGTGKTTLFKIITGELEPDSGHISHIPGLKIGYLQQHVCEASTKTAYEEALTVFGDLISLEKQLADINSQLETVTSSKLIEQRHIIEERFQALGGLTFAARTRSALTGLGFSAEEQALPTSALSGGQRSKIGLCKLLLSEPDLMLLDEPTNHLDIASIEWLEEFIKKSKITAIIISHDRLFLDNITNRTAEIEHSHFFVTGGNYSRFVELKEERRLAEQRVYDNTMKEARRIEGIIEQQRRWNREKNIKTAESKEKQLKRLTEGLTRPEDELEGIKFQFEAAHRSGDEVLKAANLNAVFDDKVLFRNAEINLRRGERVFIVGENGCGKTTLLKQILSAVNSETATLGANVSLGYFDQHGESIKTDSTPFDIIHDAYPNMPDVKVRNALAAFLFKGDDVFKTAGKLSGGERARVALCRLMLSGANLLFLDEPTNHLDVLSRTALEDALEGYDGTLLMVSHDRYFINKLATKILVIENASVTVLNGNYNTYCEYRLNSKPIEPKPQKQMGEGGRQYADRKRHASMMRKLTTAIAKAEAETEELENEKSRLVSLLEEPDVSSDYQRVAEISEEIRQTEEKIAEVLEKWESLSEQFEEESACGE